MKMVYPKLMSALIAVSFLALFTLASKSDQQEEKANQKQYCEMVQLHRNNPQVGWPDFNGNFKTLCENKHEPKSNDDGGLGLGE